MPEVTVSSAYLRILVDGAREAGVDVDAFLVQEGYRETLESPEGRIPYDVHQQLWTILPRMTGDDAFGLHLAEQIEPGAFAVLDYAVRNAPTLREALRCMVRYSRLIHQGADVWLREDDAVARLGYSLPAVPGGSPRHAAEFILATWVVVIRQITEVSFAPHAVRFEHPLPADIGEHRRLMGCKPRFGESANAMDFERSLLDRSLPSADVTLNRLLDGYAQELMDRLDSPDDLGHRIRRVVAQALRGGEPTLELVSRELGMGQRTLQRRLADEGISFTALLDEMRCDLARRYLHEPSVTISETSFLLGFSEPSAFHRAFRRWTGSSPGEFRRQMLPA